MQSCDPQERSREGGAVRDGSHPLRAAMQRPHELILLGGALGVLSVLAGLISHWLGAPVLLRP
jgi:hypothetical protein